MQNQRINLPLLIIFRKTKKKSLEIDFRQLVLHVCCDSGQLEVKFQEPSFYVKNAFYLASGLLLLQRQAARFGS